MNLIDVLGEHIKQIKDRDLLINFFRTHINAGFFDEKTMRTAIEQYAPEHMGLFNAVILLV